VTYELGQIVEYVDLAGDEKSSHFPESETAKWYCAITNPNCQGRAALGLHAAGIRSFYPKVRRWVSHARVRTAVERPLLGRYIFVEVDHPNQSFGSVRAINGIEGIISNPDPISVPTIFVKRLRERYMDGEWDFVRTDIPCPWYDQYGDLKWRQNREMPIGAQVKIMEGEFNDMLATITGRNKNGKLLFQVVDSIKTGIVSERLVRAA
jgi:transcription antitermination factor NusG